MSSQTGTTSPAEEKRRRLAELLRRKASGPRTYPASLQQRRLWFVDQMDPGNETYNQLFGARLRGPLDVRVLERALEALVERHEALRTHFELKDGEPVQVVQPPFPVRLEVEEDFSHMEKKDADQAWIEPTQAFERQPFDLGEGPLFRTKLMRLGPGRHLLAIAMHHTIMDGWSQKLIFDELNALYHAFLQDRPSPLPPLRIQYGDYAAWQRGHLSEERLAADVAYWRDALAGMPALVELPADHPRPAVQGYEGGTVEEAIDVGVRERLERVAREAGATDFMLTLAAFAVLVSRLTGEERIVFGTPIAGRTRPEVEPIVGYFANTLALPVDVSGDPTFRELVGRVKEATLGAFAHQEMPFEKLVEALEVERSLGHNPVYQVMFTYQAVSVRMEEEDVPEGGVHIKAIVPPSKTVISDLTATFHAHEDDGRLIAHLDYRADLFEEETAQRWCDHFAVLAEAIADDPDRRISAYPLLTDADRAQLVDDFNAPGLGAPAPATLHSLFERRAASQPDVDAVVHGDVRWTYADLDAHANRIAHHLVSLGVGPEERVGISLPRTPELLAAMLGVLKAGGAYLPLDPMYPPERIRHMLDDSGVGVVLTDRTLGARLPESEATLVHLDELDLSGLPAGAPDVEVDVRQLAYCIYTSGSTGLPKAVMVQHGSTTALMQWLDGTMGVEERSGVIAATSVSFDVSVAEVFGTLTAGGTLIMAENALALGEMWDSEPPIQYAYMAPSSVAELLRTDGVPPTLNTIDLGGEAVPLELGDRLYAAGVKRVINGYGPTEAAVYSSWYVVPPGVQRMLIGVPLTGTRLYVLDEAMELDPVGVVGELYVGGVGVARGYQARPGLTADRFRPDPYAGVPGARMYRTGDRARWTREGQVEYLGRFDHQVKLRGLRIELGEVAEAMRAVPGVSDAVAVVLETTPGEQRLVGYAAGAGLDGAALREALRETLPDFMVPSVVVAMEALPLTPNDKIDRRALPVPEFTADLDAFVAPRTPTEESVAAVWRDVLGLETVGVHDDFFTVGGHSLAATRVVSRVGADLGVKVAVRAVFEHSTIEKLAAHVDGLLREAAAAEAAAAAPPLVPVERDGPPPLSFAQERLWFVDRLAPGSAVYNIPATVPVGDAAPETVARALAEVVRRHEALRTTFRPTDEGGAVQVIHPAPETFALPVVDLTALPEDERPAEAERRWVQEARTPFDLEAGPLLRALLFRVSDDEQVLLATMHHTVSDGWSVGVLGRELEALIGALERGDPSPLPELPVQYADFAVWQRAWLSGDELETQLAYWRSQLAGAPPLLDLPTDGPRPAMQTFVGATRLMMLPKEAGARLASLARGENATLFMGLLAAFGAVLSRWSGRDDVVVGSPVAGRNRAEIEPLIGFFVNNLVLRADLGGDPSFRELLRRVREATLGAYAHQDVPFEKLVEELETERSLAHTPLFQVVFNLLTDETGGGTGGASPEEGAEWSSEIDSAKYDLSLTAQETETGILLALTYNVDLFQEATAARMLRHLRSLVQGAVVAPDRPLSTLEVLEEEEREAVLGRWSGPGDEMPDDVAVETFPRMFEARVRATPDAAALVSADRSVSFREADAWANRLAHRLVRMGVGPDARVAVSLPRSPELALSLLAAMKAGGAYVPVDPGYPAERRRHMLEDSGAAVVLTHSSLVEELPETEAEVVAVDALDLSGEPETAPEVALSPDDLAYVIYTSGSTGRPKGVMVPHRGLGAVAAAIAETSGIVPGTRILQFTSVSFDASLLELLGGLVAGGELYVATADELVPGEPLLRTLRERRIEVSLLPPSVLAVLPDVELPALRTLQVGGEASTPDLLRRWAPGRRVVNAYGPTETTVACTLAVLDEADAERPRVPIGRAVPGARTYVLDERLRPCPVGVAGELYVGGRGVSRGYLGRPARTAEGFVPDPFSAEPGARMYATGDRVRWTADGRLEFFGRLDDQVKVRGHRVELGEVEAALRAQPGVAHAAARVHGEGSDTLLVGYVVADGAAPDAGSLRAGLGERLPGFMVPAAVTVLDALPMTPSGKVDRRALPRPDLADAGAYVAPSTPTEEGLAEIWAEVLGAERVSAGADFFASGGHSLAATQVIARIRGRFGVDLPLRTLFEAPTVRALAKRLDAARAGGTAEEDAAGRPAVSRISRAPRRGGGPALDDE